MKKSLLLMLIGLVAVSLAAGCKDKAPQTTAQPAPATAPAAAPQEASAPGVSGKVTETMNSGGYTYIQVDTGAQQVWAAAPEFQVKVGDPVIVPEGMPMANFTSPSLNRAFDVVYFVPSVMVGGADGAAPMGGAAMPGAPGASGDLKMPEGHPPVTGAANATKVDLTGIKKADGGKTVSEVYSGKNDLAGKDVAIRGKVVKFSPEIMGKNWIHLQDGTGGEGTNDLTITTSGVAKVGDTVLVTGKVTLGKDFGYGYKYDVILEDAKVAVE